MSEPHRPTAASWAVGAYADGSGPVATISYDAGSRYSRESVWVSGGDSGSERWIAFDWQHADAIADAIKEAAAALRAIHSTSTPGTGETANNGLRADR